MVRIIDAANYLFNEYKSISGGSLLDEMKLHKLLYLAQRESLAIFGRPLFYESFEGWKFGPVSPDVRKVYSNGGIQAITNDVSPEASIIGGIWTDRVLESKPTFSPGNFMEKREKGALSR